MTFEQLLNGPFDGGLFHLFLELVLKHAVELLHVVLHEGVIRVPAERSAQVFGGNVAMLGVLQTIKDRL